jgi:hypothetical protein
MQRRPVLVGTTSLIAGLAGCSGLSRDPSMLNLVLINLSENPYTVELSLFRSDEASRSEARDFSGRIDIEPEDDTERTQVAEAQPYTIEYSVYEDNSRLTDQDHIHFLPRDDGEDDTLTFDVDSTGMLSRR